VAPLPLAVAERVVALTLSDALGETTHWTGAAMAKAVAISLSLVQRIWCAHGLQPHRVRQFKLSRDPEFVPKLRKIVGLYIDPLAHAMVLSVDEKIADPGARPHLAGSAREAGALRHDDPRLKEERHHHVVRRA
jgi:hypothetical protein